MKRFVFLAVVILIYVSFSFAQDKVDDEFIDPTLLDSTEVTNSTAAPTLDVSEPSNADSGLDLDTSTDTNFVTETAFVTDERVSGDVVMEKQPDYTLSYKQRRSRHGVLFSATYESFYPINYFSQYRDVYIENIIGEGKINLVGAELGYKLNFKLGSVALLAGFAKGNARATLAGDERSLDLTRMGLSANVALDNFFEEPWVVPYGQVGIHKFDVDEDNLSTESNNYTSTGLSFNYKFGLLFQLNWIERSIDPATEIEGMRSSGLENTFLDVYMIKHFASSDVYDPANDTSQGDPDLESDLELGLGLKMEF